MYTEKERDKREKQEENKKHTSRDNRGFFPNAQQILFYYKERLCLFEYKALKENKRREIKDR